MRKITIYYTDFKRTVGRHFMITVKQYKEELEYFFQIPGKFERQLKGIYETNSNEEWDLIDKTYEPNMVGCDYKNCRRANPKNGINHVFHVRNKTSGELLRLGSDCYFKLMTGKNDMSRSEKKESSNFLKNVNKVQKDLDISIEHVKDSYKKMYLELKVKIEKLENPSMLKELAIAEEKIIVTSSINGLKHIAKLLEIYYNKYQRELQNAYQYGRHTTRYGAVKYYIKETGEIIDSN